MAGEHVLDLRSTGAAVDPVDDAFPLHEDECRNRRHSEAFGQLRLLLDVDTHHAEPGSFLPSKVREEALHASCRA